MDKRERVLRGFFSAGKLRSWPAKQSKQLIVLAELIRDFQPEVAYQEKEVNSIILQRYDDFCLIRRSFVDLGFMRRADAVYRLNPVHRWPTFREQYTQVAERIRNEYKSRPDVLALGCFGSLRRSRLWTHSDLDLILVVELPQPAAAYQELDGVPVHWQLLTPTLLRSLDRAGLPLLQALAGVQIWSDPTGLLRTAVAHAESLLQERRPEMQFHEIMRMVAQLHQAERSLELDDEQDARLSLTNALQSLASVQLADHGETTARRSFTGGNLALPAASLCDSLQTLPLTSVLQQTWQQVRLRLPVLSQPLLRIIAGSGGMSYPELEQHPQLRGRGLSERLLHELCLLDTITQTRVPHPMVGWEFKFRAVQQ